jgi:hypothetical protein
MTFSYKYLKVDTTGLQPASCLPAMGLRESTNFRNRRKCQPMRFFIAGPRKHSIKGYYAAARLTLNTLSRSYTTGDYGPRAGLAPAVSWLREGDAHGLAQARSRVQGLIQFYPDMMQAAEAQPGESTRLTRVGQ